MVNLLRNIAQAIENLEEERADKLIQLALKLSIDPEIILQDGLGEGLCAVGERFERQEYFLLELFTAGQLGVRLFQKIAPHLIHQSTFNPIPIVISTVSGDLHDIGKNLIAFSLKAAGYQVYDMGVDVHPVTIIRQAQKVDAGIIALSSLLQVTMPKQAEVIQYLNEMGIRDQFSVVVGGGKTTHEWSVAIGADGWAASASEALTLINNLMRVKESKINIVGTHLERHLRVPVNLDIYNTWEKRLSYSLSQVQ